MKEPHMRIVIAIFFANLRDPAKHHKIQLVRFEYPQENLELN